MRKFWMMGGAAIALAAGFAAWECRPARPAEDLLAKAQSEFAIKARDALIQRRMAQAPAQPATTEASPPAPVSSSVIAAAEPAAAPAMASPDSATPAEAPAAAATDAKETTDPRMAAQPDAAPAENPAASASASSEAQTSVAAPASAAPPQPEKAVRKTHRSPNESSANSSNRRASHEASKYSMPYGFRALRARAPEIAAAIARYM